MTGTNKNAGAADETAEAVGAKATRAAASSGFEVSAAMREAAETGLNQAREAYDSYKSLAEATTSQLEESFASVNKGVGALQSKLLETGRQNVDAGFELAARMLATRSVGEAVEVQTRFAREQIETMSQQFRDFQELTAKVQTEAAKPLREGLSRTVAQFQRAG